MLGAPDAELRPRAYLLCELPGLILDLLGSIELVDQPDLIGPASVDLTAREQDVFALRRPDEVHELFSCAQAVDEPQLGGCDPEPRARVGDAEVARESNPATAADARTLHHRDGRFLHRIESPFGLVGSLVVDPGALRVGTPGLELTYVGACGKRAGVGATNE